jgi:Zn-dependent protease with chaperone function
MEYRRPLHEAFGYTTGMNLEPAVLETIRRARRGMLIHQAGIIAVLTAGICAVLVLSIAPFAIGNTTFSPLVKASGMSGLTWIGLVAAVVLGGAGVAFYFAGRRRDLGYYARFTRRSRDYDLGDLARFMNALEGVASGAGVEAPYVAVLDNPVPDAVTFSGKEGAVIGVTSGALERGLEYPQIEAMMAHELASAITGDYLHRPGSGRFEGASLVLIWSFAVLDINAVPVARRGNSSLFAFGVAIAMIVFLVLISLWLKWIKNKNEHDYILADSIAIKMTGKPEAMQNALQSMDQMVSRRSRVPFPESEIGLKYLFMPPRRWTEDARTFLKRRARELDYDMNERAASRRADALQQEMDELADWSEKLLQQRLENVQAILQGTWPFK